MAAVRALESWNRMMPLWATLSRSMTSFNSCSGVIGFQSLAQRSAPNTTMPRDCSRSSVAGVISKPGKRKNGVLGVVVATPGPPAARVARAVQRLGLSRRRGFWLFVHTRRLSLIDPTGRCSMRKQMVVRFFDETEGALPYREINSSGAYIHGDRDGALIGDIYLRKAAMPDKHPEQIRITIEY